MTPRGVTRDGSGIPHVVGDDLADLARLQGSAAVEDRAWLAANVPAHRGFMVPREADPFPSSVVPDEVVTHRVVDPDAVAAQVRALRFHETQVVVGDGWYALSNHVVSRLAGREGYARLDAATGRPVSEGAA